MKVLCTICMRAGSKGVKNKNLRLMNGKPLMEYTIKQAIESKIFEDIVISTDSSKIADIAQNMGLEVWFLRPKELSHDKAAKIPVIIHALHEAEANFKKKYSYIVDLDATSPLRSVDDILNAMKKFKSENAENLVTACLARKNPYFNMLEYEDKKLKLVKQLDRQVIRRQDAPDVYDMNASIYIWNRSRLLSDKPLIDENTSCYIMPEERSVDIDTESDFSYVEYLMKYN
tara:strand:- start:2097 stop:2786 length:690 start_codon:yes stop_codon:yes gene_type:complete